MRFSNNKAPLTSLLTISRFCIVVMLFASCTSSERKPLTYKEKADYCLKEKKYAEAIELYRRARELTPDDSGTYSGYALAYARKFESYLKRQLAGFKIEVDRKSFQWWVDPEIRKEGVVESVETDLFRRDSNIEKALDDAEKMCEKAKEINIQDAQAYLAQGYLYVLRYSKVKKEEAFAEVDEALLINPDYAEAYLLLAQMYAEFELDYAKSFELIKKASKIDPESDEIKKYYRFYKRQATAQKIGEALF